MEKSKRNKKGQFLKGTHWRKEQPFRNKDWLIEEYLNKERSSKDIGDEFGVSGAAVIFWLKNHKIPRRSVSSARKIKHWGLSGSDNPMWNRRGELNPNWRGGISPERQKFYTSQDWKSACSFVWKRDKATCKRCGLVKSKNSDVPFHIHHIRSFSIIEERANPENLILLCEVCHHHVHSRKNVNREYLQRE